MFAHSADESHYPPQTRPAPSGRSRGAASAICRNDVVLEPEHVRRVGLTLDCAEARELIRAEFGFETFAHVGRIVQVAAAQSPRRQRLRVRARRLDLAVVILGVESDVDESRVPARLPAGEGGRIGGTRRGAPCSDS
jgi:hypothetical protein